MSKNIFNGEKFYSRIVLELIIVLLISFLLCIWIFFGSINRNGFFVYNRNVDDSETSLKLTDLSESFIESPALFESPRYSRNTRISTTSSSSINEHIFKTLHATADEVVIQSSTETPHTIDEPIFPPVASINGHQTKSNNKKIAEDYWSKDYQETQIHDRVYDHSHMQELIDEILPIQNFVPLEPLLWEGSGGYEDDFKSYRPVQLIFPEHIGKNDSTVMLVETATDKSPATNWFDASTEYFLNAITLNRPYRRQDNNNYFEIFDMDSSSMETTTEEPIVPTEIIELSYYINGGSDFAIVLDKTAVPLNNVESRNNDEVDNDLFEAQLYNHEITTISPIIHPTIPLPKESIKYMDKFVEKNSNKLDLIDSNEITYDELFLVPQKNVLPLSTTMKPFNFFGKEFHMPNYEKPKPNFWNIFNPKFYQHNDLTMAQSKPSASHWHPFVNALKLDSFLPQENHAKHDFERFSNALNKRKNPIPTFESRTTETPIQEVKHIPEFVNIFGKSNSFVPDTDRSKWQSPFSEFMQLFNEPKAPCRHHPSLFRF